MNKLLLEFMRDNEWDDKLKFKNAAIEQMIFVRDTIGENLTHSPVFVVSTHTSKSCLLPVYALKLTNGIEIIMRENFYGWIVSIRSPFEIETIPEFCYGNGVNRDNDISNCYCEGFKNSWVYVYKNKNFNYSTFRIDSNYQLYTLIYLLNNITIDAVTNDEEIKHLSKSVIKMCIEQKMKNHPSLYGIYNVFSRTYIKATDFDFCKENNLETYLCGFDEIEKLINELSERIESFINLKLCFLIEMEKLSWGEDFS